LKIGISIAVLTTAALTVGGVVGFAADGAGKHARRAAQPDSALAAQVRVKMETARATALARASGSKFKGVELEREKGSLIWSFDLVVPGKAGIDEVNVDAVTGKVVSVGHEGARAEAREAKRDHDAAHPGSAKAANPSGRH
jgi:uncharacterized membrane protein YkoI